MKRDALQSLLRSRLGEAYSHELWRRVSDLRESLLTRHLDLVQQAQKGEIDGESLATKMNELASEAITGLRSILGDRFDEVVAVDEGFVLVDPETARQVDYTKIDPSEFVTRTDVYHALQDPSSLEILDVLSAEQLTVGQIAERLGMERQAVERRLELLEKMQLISTGESRSLTWRVKPVSSEGGETALLITDDTGEPQVFSLSRLPWLDREDAERLAQQLSGRWEYECQVSSEIGFDDEETGRGGYMDIHAIAHAYGVDAEIQAKRLWFRDIDGAQHATPPKEWRSEGGVVITRGKLSFRYTIGGDAGKTTDQYEIVDRQLEILNGEFVHIRNDGQRVRGIVRLRRMSGAEDLQWAPGCGVGK